MSPKKTTTARPVRRRPSRGAGVDLRSANARLQATVRELTGLNDDLVNLLAGTGIATVFIDTDFCVRRFTADAARLLNLIPSDLGRPIGSLTHDLGDLDLQAETEAVLRTLVPLEKGVRAPNGTDYMVRVLPYRTEAGLVQGAIITFVDVSALRTMEREPGPSRHMRETVARFGHSALAGTPLPDLLGQCVDSVAEVLGGGLVEVLEYDTARAAFVLRACTGRKREAAGATMPTAGSDSPEGIAFMSRATVTFADLRADPRFAATPLVEQFHMQAGVVVPIVWDHEPWGVLGVFTPAPRAFLPGDIMFLEAMARIIGTTLTRQHADAELHRLNESLEQRVADRTRWLTLLHEATKAVGEAPSGEQALQRLLVQICRAEDWQVGCVYLPDKSDPDRITAFVTYTADPRFAAFEDVSRCICFSRSRLLPGLVFADRRPVLVDGADEVGALLEGRRDAARQVGLRSVAVVPVRMDGQPIAVLELFSDRSHAPGDELVNLLDDVGAQVGRALERERLMAQVAEMVWREQQDLVHTLHDSLGQELTGLGLLSASLVQRCQGTHPVEAEVAGQIADVARRALDRVRQLSRGLFPVEVQAGGLWHALKELASTTEGVYKVGCHVAYTEDVAIVDGRAATQLYRIAQEAVTNALRHAHAHMIGIEVAAGDHATTLSVTDDGIGISLDEGALSNEGMGLRIMAYRAMTIGGRIAIGARPGGGTIVTCTLPELVAAAD